MPNAYPDNNPKTLVGATKVPLHLVPPSATHFLALALKDGGQKYGPYNWRDSAISISTYKAAAQRHWDAFWDGEDNAPDSGVHHLAHAMACSALLLDALTVGKLVDDRPTKGAAARLQTEYANKDKEVTKPNAHSPCTFELRYIDGFEVGTNRKVRIHDPSAVNGTEPYPGDAVVERRVPNVQKNVQPANCS